MINVRNLFSITLLTTASTLALMTASQALAAPTGGAVSAGTATIEQSGASTSIGQHSDRAVIDWQGFDVGAGERVTFQQPSASSATLNRVHSPNPSMIDGAIHANGQVVLVNPNGIVFSKSSAVNVGSLVASTANTTDNAFMAGGMLTLNLPGKADAAILNEGSITAADSGLVALVAPDVANRGVITARMGAVQLAGAETAAIDLYGDGLLSFAVTDAAQSASVTNSGRIESGHVLMSADSAASLVTSAVNQEGIIEASDLRVSADGSLVLGGDVRITARDVTVGAEATIRADGHDGGGTIHIGGGWQGEKIALPWQILSNAENTRLAAGSLISANTTGTGDGGTVVAWADNTTRFDGAIMARGGIHGGDGGTVETSGTQQLAVSGQVDASAFVGLAGSWLLDPYNVRIESGSGASIPVSGGEHSAPSPSYVIDAASISAALSAGNNVTIRTGPDGSGGETGTITIANGVAITSSSTNNVTLTLRAANSIVSTTGVSISATGSGKLHTVFWADAEAIPNNTGAVSFTNTSIQSNGGDIILGGGLDDGANGGIAGDGRPDGFASAPSSAALSGVLLTGGTLDAGTGSIRILGIGSLNAIGCNNTCWGVRIQGSSLSTLGNGSIYIYGKGGGTAASTFISGIQIFNGADISAESGSIRYIGSTVQPNTNGHSVTLGPSTTSTTNGDIIIDAPDGFAWYDNLHNAALNSGGDIILSVNDNIGTSAPVFADLDITADSFNIKPAVAGSTLSVAGVGGDIYVQSSFIDRITAGNIVIGDGSTGLVTVNPYASWASRASSGVRFVSGAAGVSFTAGAHSFGARSLTTTTEGPLSIDGALSAGIATLRSAGVSSDITIGAAGSVTASGAGDALTLASGRDFFNQRGTAALSAPAGRWLVYSRAPEHDVIGGLPYSFQQYDCSYSGFCAAPLGIGNGLVYRNSLGGGGGPTGGGGGGAAPTPVETIVPPEEGTAGVPEIPGADGTITLPADAPVPDVLLPILPVVLEPAILHMTEEAQASVAWSTTPRPLWQHKGVRLDFTREMLHELGCDGVAQDEACQALGL